MGPEGGVGTHHVQDICRCAAHALGAPTAPPDSVPCVYDAGFPHARDDLFRRELLPRRNAQLCITTLCFKQNISAGVLNRTLAVFFAFAEYGTKNSGTTLNELCHCHYV